MAALIAIALSAAMGLLVAAAARSAPTERPRSAAPLVILMVWDGLRPDSVSPANTPNLYALAHQGVYLAHHHAMYPSLTMVNAATLATGAPPSVTGIIANSMFLGPLLEGAAGPASGPLARARVAPANLEKSDLLSALSSTAQFKDRVVDVPSIAQEVLRTGGYFGIVGKSGPTFLFDDRIGGADRKGASDEIFISDDQFAPQSLAPELQGRINLAALKAAFHESPPFGEQDALLTRDFIDRALPAGAAAINSGRPALLVLWQHNPDITEHAAGVGTAAFYQALAGCDANLGKLRAAMAALHLENKADLVVVSDHGFATIKMRVSLAELLVAQRLKKSATSDDVTVAHNFGSDVLYLSPHLDSASRSGLLRKIVNYAAAQEWCGPIFSRPGASGDNGYLGEIPGTFSQAWFDLFNPARAPDLIISFRELPDEDNSALTGPRAPAFVLGKDGKQAEQNHSQPLVHPMPGVSYADSGAMATTGNGSHGALGEYEMHNFGAALGP
ncbi:MAG TPA: alkaline phosphatase family protein, partial [Candidatus Binataceae bacterium]|nr:alkaline phosphatase family protein [Candidatus Binataceae bacterium]